tara:strand:- start:642 stop:914 length:273 start_codon:yes stop_codon:yes gene_type:complete
MVLLEMLMVYFVSALVLTPVLKQGEGWIQYTQSYSTFESCHDHIKSHYKDIARSLINHFKNQDVTVKKLECLTYDEVVKRNTNLGHGNGK